MRINVKAKMNSIAQAGPALLLTAFLSTPTMAGDAMTSDVQPVCDTPENLRDFIQAVMQKDVIGQLNLTYSCGVLAAGVRVKVIEDLPSEGGAGRVVKISVPSSAGGSSVGYTVSIGLRPVE